MDANNPSHRCCDFKLSCGYNSHTFQITRPEAPTIRLSDLDGMVDFALAFAIVHELPSAAAFFAEVAAALKPGACLLLVEPAGRVKGAQFDAELTAASQAGLRLETRPVIRRSHAALLKK